MIGCMDGIKIENKFYFIDGKTGVLFRYDVSIKELQYITYLYEERLITLLPRRIFHINNKLYGVSNNGYEIFEYKMGIKELKNCTTYALEYNKNIVIKEAFIIGSQIWCIPTEIDRPIMILELNKKKAFLYKTIKELLLDTGSEFKNGELNVIKYKEGMLCFTIKDQNVLVEYNLDKKKSIVYNIDKRIAIGAFEYEGDDVWFRSEEGFSLHKWDREVGFVESYRLENEDELEVMEKNGRVIKISNGKLILLPVYSNTVVFFDENSKSLRKVSGMESCGRTKGREKITFSIGTIENDGKLWLLPWGTNFFIEIDIGSMIANCHEARIREKDEMNIYTTRWLYQSLHIESDYFTLSKQLKMLTNEKAINGGAIKNRDISESIGEKIIQCIEI